MKLTHRQLRSIIAEAAKTSVKKQSSKKRRLKEAHEDDLANQLENDQEVMTLVQQLAIATLDFTGTDYDDNFDIVDDMSRHLVDVLASAIIEYGDVKSDEGPPPLPQG